MALITSSKAVRRVHRVGWLSTHHEADLCRAVRCRRSLAHPGRGLPSPCACRHTTEHPEARTTAVELVCIFFGNADRYVSLHTPTAIATAKHRTSESAPPITCGPLSQGASLWATSPLEEAPPSGPAGWSGGENRPWTGGKVGPVNQSSNHRAFAHAYPQPELTSRHHNRATPPSWMGPCIRARSSHHRPRAVSWRASYLSARLSIRCYDSHL